ncbi:MAG: hypothetical protein E4H39_02805 [Syntrophobacterales bacterium]|nr:MAG: hypothetical protein E4H39_02805 [Syntrophobacterales bacterium]
MKIKVEREKIVGAVRKLSGIEIELEDADDASEALELILHDADFSKGADFSMLNDVRVTPLHEYENSAVDYKVLFLLDFVFEADVPANRKVALVKEFQDFLNNL